MSVEEPENLTEAIELLARLIDGLAAEVKSIHERLERLAELTHRISDMEEQ